MIKVPHQLSPGNDHEFINKEYFLYWNEIFWEAQSKAMRAYAQSGQYHTIVESHVHLTEMTSICIMIGP